MEEDIIERFVGFLLGLSPTAEAGHISAAPLAHDAYLQRMDTMIDLLKANADNTNLTAKNTSQTTEVLKNTNSTVSNIAADISAIKSDTGIIAATPSPPVSLTVNVAAVASATVAKEAATNRNAELSKVHYRFLGTDAITRDKAAKEEYGKHYGGAPSHSPQPIKEPSLVLGETDYLNPDYSGPRYHEYLGGEESKRFSEMMGRAGHPLGRVHLYDLYMEDRSVAVDTFCNSYQSYKRKRDRRLILKELQDIYYRSRGMLISLLRDVYRDDRKLARDILDSLLQFDKTLDLKYIFV